MTSEAYDGLCRRVAQHEGLCLKVYDDATGHLIGPGSHVTGHPTIGYGRALDVQGISVGVARQWLEADLDACERGLLLNWPWLGTVDDVRFGVLVEMAYQLGIAGLSGFTHVLAAVQARDWKAAGEAMVDSLWARQTPRRAAALRQILESGVDPLVGTEAPSPL